MRATHACIELGNCIHVITIGEQGGLRRLGDLAPAMADKGMKKPFFVDLAMADKVYATGSEAMLIRPCVDCGRRTGCYCDYCKAVDRAPGEVWAPGQKTPLCTACDSEHGACHICKRQAWCVQPAWE